MTRRLLGIYLNDHLAGAAIGVELARRTARENTGSPLGAFLTDFLVPQIAEDRQSLEDLMAQLRITQSRPKLLVASAAEKLGRLKPNGELRRYSPLSRLLELEGLAAGIEAKLALWHSLEHTLTGANEESVIADFAQLAARARSQRSRLEEHRLAAATIALT